MRLINPTYSRRQSVTNLISYSVQTENTHIISINKAVVSVVLREHVVPKFIVYLYMPFFANIILTTLALVRVSDLILFIVYLYMYIMAS